MYIYIYIYLARTPEIGQGLGRGARKPEQTRMYNVNKIPNARLTYFFREHIRTLDDFLKS